MFCLSEVDGKVWTVYTNNKRTGADSCGPGGALCRRIEEVLQQSQSGDVIHLTSNQKPGGAVLHHCTQQPLMRNVTIRAPARDVIIHCPQPHGFVLAIQNAHVTLEGLTFLNTSLLAMNSEVEISRSIFNQSQIFLMDRAMMENYRNYEFTANDLKQTIDDTCDASWECLHIQLKLQHVEWTQDHQDESDLFLDSLTSDGIQAICHRVQIEIEDSTMADKQVFVYATKQLDFRLTRSTFTGKCIIFHRLVFRLLRPY